MEIFNVNKESILKAVKVHGTPAYVYDGNHLVDNYLSLKNALPECVDIFYALKSNPNTSVVKLLRSKGANTEVCSLGELRIALNAGSIPQNIIFLGPSKKDYELKEVISLGIYALVIESEDELRRVSRIAGELNLTANVAVRINPDFSADGSPWKMGGRPTQFGIDEHIAFENFEKYLATENVNIRGIHVYNGTNILNAESVYENTKYILNYFRKISNKYQTNFTMVDVGGGMGTPYYANQEALDMEVFKNLLYPLFEEFRAEYPDTRILMESGRYIAANAGYFAVEVNNMKVNHAKSFVITDGGTNCHSSAAGTGRVVKRNFPTKNISANENSEEHEYQLTGPLCSPDDIIARNVMMKETKVGDIIVIAASGAYGSTSSPGLFHSHGFPAEVLLYEDEVYLIRERDSVDDIIGKHTVVTFKEAFELV